MSRWGKKAAPVRGSTSKIDLAPWSDTELRQLREMRADDMSPRFISQKLNRTVKSVEEKLAELRAPRQ